MVTPQFKEDPLSGHLYAFTNRRKNRVKLLYYDGTGVWVCAKRLWGFFVLMPGLVQKRIRS